MIQYSASGKKEFVAYKLKHIPRKCLNPELSNKI